MDSPARLKGERDFCVTKGVPLAIDGADGDAEVVGVLLGQLGDVVGHLALCVLQSGLIKLINVTGEPQEIRNDKLVPQGPGDQHYVFKDQSEIEE